MTTSEFDPAERFVAGTVGPPGSRVFFLQAADRGRVVSVSLEKLQVSMLGERMADLLDRVGNDEPALPADNEPLRTPIEDEFRVSAIGLAWDQESRRIVVECHDHDPDEQDLEREGQTLRVVLTAGQAREFARRAEALVAAGRPPCPFCGQPLDPNGHICPRANGYRR